MTAYALAPQIRWCRVDGVAIFLDVRRDQFFVLPETEQHCFDRLAAGCPIAADELGIAALEGMGVIGSQSSGNPISATRPVLALRRAEQGLASVPPLQVGLAATAAIAARAQLRFAGLERSLARLIAVKRRVRPDAQHICESHASAIAAAFHAARWLTSSHDQCLSRALAIAHLLVRRSCLANLVVGVAIRPFAAHAWVQMGDLLVGEDMARVSHFTPIMMA